MRPITDVWPPIGLPETGQTRPAAGGREPKINLPFAAPSADLARRATRFGGRNGALARRGIVEQADRQASNVPFRFTQPTLPPRNMPARCRNPAIKLRPSTRWVSSSRARSTSATWCSADLGLALLWGGTRGHKESSTSGGCTAMNRPANSGGSNSEKMGPLAAQAQLHRLDLHVEEGNSCNSLSGKCDPESGVRRPVSGNMSPAFPAIVERKVILSGN